jgi:hypothetical protein
MLLCPAGYRNLPHDRFALEGARHQAGSCRNHDTRRTSKIVVETDTSHIIVFVQMLRGLLGYTYLSALTRDGYYLQAQVHIPAMADDSDHRQPTSSCISSLTNYCDYQPLTSRQRLPSLVHSCTTSPLSGTRSTNLTTLAVCRLYSILYPSSTITSASRGYAERTNVYAAISTPSSGVQAHHDASVSHTRVAAPCRFGV